MNNTKITPGPWNFIKKDLVVASKKDLIADCNFGISTDECEANANLIAAAPDMYEALKQVLTDSRTSNTDDAYAEITWETIEQIKAALLKANPPI